MVAFVRPSSLLWLALGYALASVAFVALAYRLIDDDVRASLRRLTSLKPAPARAVP